MQGQAFPKRESKDPLSSFGVAENQPIADDALVVGGQAVKIVRLGQEYVIGEQGEHPAVAFELERTATAIADLHAALVPVKGERLPVLRVI